MPHPEHAVDPLLGSSDGGLVLGSLVDSARAGNGFFELGRATDDVVALRADA